MADHCLAKRMLQLHFGALDKKRKYIPGQTGIYDPENKRMPVIKRLERTWERIKEHLAQPGSNWISAVKNLPKLAEEPPDEIQPCEFCLENIDEGDPIFTLTCRHFFHADCLGMFIRSQPIHLAKCPVCRTPIDVYDFIGKKNDPLKLYNTIFDMFGKEKTFFLNRLMYIVLANHSELDWDTFHLQGEPGAQQPQPPIFRVNILQAELGELITFIKNLELKELFKYMLIIEFMIQAQRGTFIKDYVLPYLEKHSIKPDAKEPYSEREAKKSLEILLRYDKNETARIVDYLINYYYYYIVGEDPEYESGVIANGDAGATQYLLEQVSELSYNNDNSDVSKAALYLIRTTLDDYSNTKRISELYESLIAE